LTLQQCLEFCSVVSLASWQVPTCQVIDYISHNVSWFWDVLERRSNMIWNSAWYTTSRCVSLIYCYFYWCQITVVDQIARTLAWAYVLFPFFTVVFLSLCIAYSLLWALPNVYDFIVTESVINQNSSLAWSIILKKEEYG
jgi:hypothetical protein